MRLNFVENGQRVDFIDDGNNIISSRNVGNNLYQEVVELLEEEFPGFRWYYNPRKNREWAFGPHAINMNDNDRQIIWAYPFGQHQVVFYLPFSFYKILKIIDDYVMINEVFDNRNVIGSLNGYDVKYREFKGVGNFIEIRINDNHNLHEIISIISENIENIRH